MKTSDLLIMKSILLFVYVLLLYAPLLILSFSLLPQSSNIIIIMHTTNHHQNFNFPQHHQLMTLLNQTDLRRHPRSILRPSRTLQSRR